MCDFTDDEIRCLRKVILREREAEISELYKKAARKAYQEKAKLEREYQEKAKREAEPTTKPEKTVIYNTPNTDDMNYKYQVETACRCNSVEKQGPRTFLDKVKEFFNGMGTAI
jgi:hypothetical protein